MDRYSKYILYLWLALVLIAIGTCIGGTIEYNRDKAIEVYTIEHTFPVSLQDADIPMILREYNLTVEFTMFDDNHVDIDIVDMVFIKHVVDIGNLEVFSVLPDTQ